MGSHKVSVGGLCEGTAGMMAPRLIRDEGLGTFLPMFVGPWEPKLVREVCEFCRANGLKLRGDEYLSRMSGKLRDDYKPVFDETMRIFKEYPDVVCGSSFFSEYGGVRFYWPLSSVCHGVTQPKTVGNFVDAEADCIQVLKDALEQAIAQGMPRPYTSTEARGLAAHFYLRAGVDYVGVEMTYHRDAEMQFAACKGASLAFGREWFSTDLATIWYGGNTHDELWFKRWKISLYHAFLRGADPIHSEHGVVGYQNTLGFSADEKAPDVVRFRKILGEFADYARKNPRPDGFPLASVAVMQGRLDGFVGMDQTHIWGQRTNEAYRISHAEHSWELYNSFYRRRLWENRDKVGAADYSGNPPLGQVDIIPYDIPDDILHSYKMIIFLGRNSMDETLYRKLCAYVEQGGQLLLTTAHLDASIVPDGSFIPFNQGDWSDLCGVRLRSEELIHPFGVKFCQNPPGGWQLPLWTAICDPKYPGAGYTLADLELCGAQLAAVVSERFNDLDLNLIPDSGTSATSAFGDDETSRANEWANLTTPMMTFFTKGRGCTILVNSREYPGHPGLQELYSFLMTMACDAHRGYPRVECGDRVRFAVYPGSPRSLYLLNTEENLPQTVIIQWNEHDAETITIPPATMLGPMTVK